MGICKIIMIEFKLSEKEEAAARQFMEEHRHKDAYKGAIGGHLEFLFSPTSIGVACCIHCTICGEKKNITDYSNW